MVLAVALASGTAFANGVLKVTSFPGGANVYVDGEDTGKTTPMTVNLSETGMFVGARRILEPGSAVSVDLVLRDARPKLRGVVVWSRSLPQPGLPVGMGVRLFAPPPAYSSFVASL